TRKDVQTALVRVTEGHISLEWHKAEEFLNRKENHDEAPRITIPSRLANPNLLNPFQRLVTNYGIPAYGTVDPTILVAIAYLAMFGLMFGDAGHGLVLILTGLAGQAWTRKRKGLPMPSGGMASSIPFLSRLMLWCGLAAVVAGVLFGSYFGMSLLPSIWFNYHGVVAGHVEAGSVQSIFDILRITIFFGITVIGLGLLINWVNLVRQKRWFSLFFDNSGLLGGIIYAAGIIISYKFASSGFKYLPDNPILYWIIIACAMILFLKAPLKERGGNPLWWLMEWMISLLEIFSGYLANTLSFMRVAGLGIAHVTLMIAFFQIAKMASPEGFNVWAILIMILGNALVIALEGLSAGIQSLRLNYYEFFSKYFQPSGVEYKPISLEEK
ncbi:MAG: ATPase V, partial [Spirochaetes bacterium]